MVLKNLFPHLLRKAGQDVSFFITTHHNTLYLKINVGKNICQSHSTKLKFLFCQPGYMNSKNNSCNEIYICMLPQQSTLITDVIIIYMQMLSFI